jgi:hypothetical protein
MSIRVTFSFPNDSVVRYAERRPRRGETVAGLLGETFVISKVESDGAGGHIATCVTPVEYTDGARDVARSARALASEMTERAIELRRRALGSRKRV